MLVQSERFYSQLGQFHENVAGAVGKGAGPAVLPAGEYRRACFAIDAGQRLHYVGDCEATVVEALT
jgi:hypothetical protein